MKTRIKLVVWVLLGVTSVALVVLATVGLRTQRYYAVQTGSMTPAIPSKSLVVVEPGRYQVGQPIVFRQHGGIVTHRLVGINADGSLVTKGDANRTPDPSSVSPSDVVGGVIAAPKYLGYWLMYLKSPLGFASFVVNILLIYQISVLFSNEDTKPVPKTALQPA